MTDRWKKRAQHRAARALHKDARDVTALIETGSDIAGGSAAAAIGLIVAGPPGALGGAAAGPLMTRAFRVVGADVRRRVLGPREEVRIGATLALAAAAIGDELAKGCELRQDGFFEGLDDSRPAAEEVLEGVLLKARDSYEEKKIGHLSYLFAAVATDQTITTADANSVIELTHRLTYRQLVCLSFFYDPDPARLPHWRRGQRIPRTVLSLAGELVDLGQLGLLERADRKRIEGLGDIDPHEIRTVRTGRFLYRLLRLDLVAAKDADELF